MERSQLERWRREVLTRFDALEVRAHQVQQFLSAHDLGKLEDKADFEAAWEKIKSLFPKEFLPDRTNDLERHIYFGMRQDFSDIESLDIPAVRRSVERYGRRGETFIKRELERVQFNSPVSDLIHPQIKDACADLINSQQYREAARAAVGLVMDEIRRLGRVESDGDSLIRNAIGTEPGSLGLSDCLSDNAKQVTKGLKLVVQGLYQGVRNPLSHGWNGYSYIEVLQIMVTCSVLLTRLQVVELSNDDSG